jgi:hypothetical protein
VAWIVISLWSWAVTAFSSGVWRRLTLLAEG